MQKLKKSHEFELENLREELNTKIEKLQTQIDEDARRYDETLSA